ncbi:conserved hypothetical protein [Verticillium alfalfae VaMs.102]|uniref:Altered inheritance of mitochondria protein 19 n=1 Tax=Verticillium alfalfae (strain VaMs.102 / ATCC MYA-4576 / FGSC 10136) TaxID=526221 RepID=C9SJU0_VERA1|nr:conserved hypothetical protein [Verticillium alfalfae VaMs.102]EEY19704.1 conserved hypothetical protein [Verticillium alfalfae VaMs.102]
MSSPQEEPGTTPGAATLPQKLTNWGTSCMPPAIHAILIAALHGKPVQPLPLLIAPALLFSSYVSLAGFPTDAAGLTCAWSGIYTLLALRRRQPIRSKFSARGVVRAGALSLGLANCVAGGFAYAGGNRKIDEIARKERNRWAE